MSRFIPPPPPPTPGGGGGGRGATSPTTTNNPASPTGSGSAGVGQSPTGTVSPNSGAAANTNSAYRGGAFSSGVNALAAGTTAYRTADTDYQGMVVFNESSAVTVTLHYSASQNFATTIFNIGTGAMTLTPDIPPGVTSLYTVNGNTSLSLSSGQGAIVGFADRLWYAKVI